MRPQPRSSMPWSTSWLMRTLTVTLPSNALSNSSAPVSLHELPARRPRLLTRMSTAPRPSATVLLVRGRDPWELLLVHRPGGSDFAAGAYVFPGGTVHADDMGWGDEIRMAALREVFEEVGILLARRGRRFVRQAESDGVRSIVEGGKSFGEALRELRLEPALDSLVMLARWITSLQLPRRYDGRFLLAHLAT